jgi:hypothetical protein
MAADEAAVAAGRQHRALTVLVAAYGGNTYRLLRDLGDHIGASLAYVDRATVEAHLERSLTNAEWDAANDQFTAMDFDDHVGDHGTIRTDWIETVLANAEVPGYTDDAETLDARRLRRPSTRRPTADAVRARHA